MPTPGISGANVILPALPKTVDGEGEISKAKAARGAGPSWKPRSKDARASSAPRASVSQAIRSTGAKATATVGRAFKGIASRFMAALKKVSEVNVAAAFSRPANPVVTKALPQNISKVFDDNAVAEQVLEDADLFKEIANKKYCPYMAIDTLAILKYERAQSSDDKLACLQNAFIGAAFEEKTDPFALLGGDCNATVGINPFLARYQKADPASRGELNQQLEKFIEQCKGQMAHTISQLVS